METLLKFLLVLLHKHREFRYYRDERQVYEELPGVVPLSFKSCYFEVL